MIVSFNNRADCWVYNITSLSMLEWSNSICLKDVLCTSKEVPESPRVRCNHEIAGLKNCSREAKLWKSERPFFLLRQIPLHSSTHPSLQNGPSWPPQPLPLRQKSGGFISLHWRYQCSQQASALGVWGFMTGLSTVTAFWKIFPYPDWISYIVHFTVYNVSSYSLVFPKQAVSQHRSKEGTEITQHVECMIDCCRRIIINLQHLCQVYNKNGCKNRSIK